MAVKEGAIVEDFTLKNQADRKIDTADFKDGKILLSFHPLAWTSVCAKQMQSIEDNYKKFKNLNVVPLGISVDSAPCKKAWAESLGIKQLDLLADFWPHGALAQRLNIFLDTAGISERVNIILDDNRKIIFIKVYPIKELPDINEIIGFLEK
jgi:peroxiredoxin